VLQAYQYTTQVNNFNIQVCYTSSDLYLYIHQFSDYSDFVHQPWSTNFPSTYIVENPKFNSFFEDAIGAMDGTHFISSDTAEEQALAYDCKGLITMNCLAECDFNHNLTYLSTG